MAEARGHGKRGPSASREGKSVVSSVAGRESLREGRSEGRDGEAGCREAWGPGKGLRAWKEAAGR